MVIYKKLCTKYADPHEAEHQMIECLAESIWEAQRHGHAVAQRESLQQPQPEAEQGTAEADSPRAPPSDSDGGGSEAGSGPGSDGGGSAAAAASAPPGVEDVQAAGWHGQRESAPIGGSSRARLPNAAVLPRWSGVYTNGTNKTHCGIYTACCVP